MRTGLLLLSGLLLLAASLILGKLFSANYPGGTTVATVLFVALWLAISLANMWVGVAKAGYSVADEQGPLPAHRGKGSGPPLQLEPRRQHEARHRLPRRRGEAWMRKPTGPPCSRR